MPKAKAEGNGSLETVVEPVESAETEALDEGNDDRGDMVATVATLAVVGVAAAAFEVALLPGIILGVAAVAVAEIFSKDGRSLGPALQVDRTRRLQARPQDAGMMAEAQEQFHDIAAEVHAEKCRAVASKSRRGCLSGGPAFPARSSPTQSAGTGPISGFALPTTRNGPVRR